jgi:hypothetical protein
MADEPNPYAPPTERAERVPDEDPNDPPERELSLAEPGKERWAVRVRPAELRFVPPDDRPQRVLDHRAFVERTSFNLHPFVNQLVLEAPTARLKLGADDLAVLRRWLDPVVSEHLARRLRRGRVFKLAIGVIFVGGTLIGRLGALDVPSLAVGLAWLAWVVAARVKPHRALVLVEAALWIPFGVWPVLRVLEGGGVWNLIFVVFVVQIVVGCVRVHRFYGPVR